MCLHSTATRWPCNMFTHKPDTVAPVKFGKRSILANHLVSLTI